MAAKRKADDRGDCNSQLKHMKADAADTTARSRLEEQARKPALSRRRSTRSETVAITDGPRKATFATAELLEHIVLQLPVKDIYAVQRVSRQFRDLLRTSTRIQEKLFVRLTEERTLWELCYDADAESRRKWVIVNNVSDVLNDPKLAFSAPQSQRIPAKLNPCLSIAECHAEHALMRLKYGGWEKVYLHMQDNLSYSAFLHAMSGPLGSAFLTDPPSDSAKVFIYWNMTASRRRKAEGRLILDLSDYSSGLTFNHLREKLRTEESNYQYWIGSRRYNIVGRSFDEVHAHLLGEGFKPAVFKPADILLELRGVAFASTEERRNVSSTGKNIAGQPS